MQSRTTCTLTLDNNKAPREQQTGAETARGAHCAARGSGSRRLIVIITVHCGAIFAVYLYCEWLPLLRLPPI